MQPQESHQQMPARQSPCDKAQKGQAVLMGPQRCPPIMRGPKTRETTGSTTIDGSRWSKQGKSRLPAKSLGETGEESPARHLSAG